MSIISPISRTCTEISSGNADQYPPKASRPLEDFRDTSAYVLLGDPGVGKTTAFEAECEAIGKRLKPIPARDFLTFDPQRHPEWFGKTLFIDGLDEVRAGSYDAHTPFDAIRGRLDALGRPRFRLSCRETDWLGANDRERLEVVSPDSGVTVLRLDPLAAPDIEKLLDAHPYVDDAEAFIAEANRRGIGALLGNPQTLDLLAKAVAGGDWPKSRKETFEMACSEMVRESNREHQTASASSSLHTPAQLLGAAGCLCAVQLIAGKAGYTLHGEPDDEYPALDQCEYAHPEKLRLVLGSRMLFKGVGPSDNRFTPIHRHIAEFLGARHLAQIIGNGLPARRVIALITGGDGAVVTEMRGLSAWLAAHCQEARMNLIERDAIGVGLYGDIRGFSLDEKRKLLAFLRREGDRIDPWFDPRSDFQVDAFRERAVIFGALATPDMEPALREILEDGKRDLDSQVFVDFVLRVLEEGVPLADLSEVLLTIVRDNTRLPRVNTSALRAFMHNCPHSQDKTNEIKRLLTDVHTGKLTDSSDDRLLGMLLTVLYPDDVTPREVWSCYFKQEERDPIGRLWWLWKIVEKASDEHVSALLDSLSQHLSELPPDLEFRHLNYLALKLLARGLRTHGDQLDTTHLYDWLGVGEIGPETPIMIWDDSNRDIRDIRSWLEQRPEVQKAVILEGLDRCPYSDDFRFHAYRVEERLYHASLPPDFGYWCLQQAVARADAKPQVAEYLLEEVFYRRESEGLTLDILKGHAQKNDTLRAKLDCLIASRTRMGQLELERRERDRTFTEEQRQKGEKWLDHVRENEAALRENRAAPALLHQLSKFYFRTDSTSRGPKAVEETLQSDRHLTQAILQSFRGAVERQDVPAFEETLRIRAEDRMPYLAWPFLAGLAEIERTAPEDAARWDDERIRKALALYFSYGVALSDDQPAWYQRLLLARPETVAEVQVKYAVSEFRSGRAFFSKLWELAHDKAHAQVAERASLPLLRAFPTRCKLNQLGLLDYLLWAAIQYADGTTLRDLIERKLSRTSMNNAQRVHWLAAGFAVAPEVYEAPLSDFVQGREKRIRQLAEFFCQIGPPSSWFDGLGIRGLARFIRLVGGHVGPEPMNTQGWVTPAMKASRLVYHRIQRNLAVSPEKAASDALAALLADPALSRWHDVLSQGQAAQRVIRRDAGYRHTTVDQVCQTLDGGTPANPGDLAALVLDRLNAIADQISTNNANCWRPYWNEDKDQKPTKPKHENSCRDALIRDLRLHFPNAEPEVTCVDSKRADIRVACRSFHVPVEIKKNSHRELWSAMRNQLIGQYTNTKNAPETDGYGIYLVFWFGKQYTQAPDSGNRPADAGELRERLEATLSADERRKISVCVIDVSKP